MKVYQAHVTRDGEWWMVAIPELDGLTQARRLSEATEMARSYIAVTLNISPESFEVQIVSLRGRPSETTILSPTVTHLSPWTVVEGDDQ